MRLLTENRELLHYKAKMDKMAIATKHEEQVEKSLQNKQTLDKFAASQRSIKVQSVTKKASKLPATASGNNESWEVAPNPSKICTELTEEDVNEEAEEVVGILNHRKKIGGAPEMLMKFDNGERLWASVEVAYTDGRSVVESYLTGNNLLDSAFEPKQMRKRKTDKTAMAVQKKCEPVEQVKCSHDDYRAEIGGYKPEGDCRYFIPKYGLGDCLCALCKTKFVPTGTTTSEIFRPSISKPALLCVNRLYGCKHGVCYDCFIKKGMSISPGLKNSRCRSTRDTINKN